MLRQIGLRVRYLPPDSPRGDDNPWFHSFLHQEGTIYQLGLIGCYVRFDHPIHHYTDWYMGPGDKLEAIFASPEEEVQAFLQCRLEEEKRLDQQRRHEHAMRYL